MSDEDGERLGEKGFDQLNRAFIDDPNIIIENFQTVYSFYEIICNCKSMLREISRLKTEFCDTSLAKWLTSIGFRGTADTNSFENKKEAAKLDEVDVVACPRCHKNQKEKVLIVYEHKLGIKSWCIKSLYLHVYRKLLKQRNTSTNTDYSATDSLQVTRAVLLLGAECCIAWNIRKEMITAGVLNIRDELQFSTLVLTKHPRSAEAFAHRKWVISYFVKVNSQGDFVKQLLRREFAVCQRAAEIYPDNYTAWSHRGWIVDTFMTEKPKKLLSEFKSTEQWVQMHVSDHSGFHYRQLLLKHITKLCSREEAAFLWISELELISDIILSYPGHEATWYHRRAVFYNWNYCFGGICTDSLRQSLICHLCKGKNDVTYGDSCSVGRRSPVDMEQEQHLLLHSCSSSGQSSDCGATNMTVGLKLIESNWLQRESKFNSRTLLDNAVSLPNMATELEFCDKAITSCKTNTKEHQVKFALNHRRWLNLLT